MLPCFALLCAALLYSGAFRSTTRIRCDVVWCCIAQAARPLQSSLLFSTLFLLHFSFICRWLRPMLPAANLGLALRWQRKGNESANWELRFSGVDVTAPNRFCWWRNIGYELAQSLDILCFGSQIFLRFNSNQYVALIVKVRYSGNDSHLSHHLISFNFYLLSFSSSSKMR